MTKATLNQGQQAAADAFLGFLMTEERFFTISGPAGTGKTFLMAHLANQVMKEYEQSCRLIDVKPEYDSVVFTATTNKATEALEAALGKPVQTIHSWLGLKVQENFKTGKTTLERTTGTKVRRRLILFVDECSMIDKALFAELADLLPDCKIVFVGDHAQMAPVNESLSLVYTEGNPENRVVLTEPVRNAEQPALMALCDQLRDTVETGVFNPIREVPGVIDYLDDDSMPAWLHNVFPDLNPSSRVLCFTNTRVQSFNEFIREDVRQLPVTFQPGDVAVVAQAFSRGQSTFAVEREFEIVSVGEVEWNREFEPVVGEAIAYRQVSICAPGSASFGGVIEGIPIAENPDRVNLLIKRLAKQRNWGDYFDLKNAFLDLRDKAACTVYKSQGSTYDSVFIDLGNIGTSYDAEQVARMLYVAASRARSRVFLYGRLPNRYHNSGGPLWTVKDMSASSPISSLNVKSTSVEMS